MPKVLRWYLLNYDTIDQQIFDTFRDSGIERAGSMILKVFSYCHIAEQQLNSPD